MFENILDGKRSLKRIVSLSFESTFEKHMAPHNVTSTPLTTPWCFVNIITWSSIRNLILSLCVTTRPLSKYYTLCHKKLCLKLCLTRNHWNPFVILIFSQHWINWNSSVCSRVSQCWIILSICVETVTVLEVYLGI